MRDQLSTHQPTSPPTGVPPSAGLRWPHWIPLLALALAILPAALPYFGEGLPRTNDAFPHLYRVVALDRLVRQGILWPRWSPDLVHGYGYPVFNFFPSLSHLVMEGLHLMGLPLTAAYRWATLLQLWVAGWSMFLLGRTVWNAAAGWIAALAYIYSPFLLYDTIVRGSLPEIQALALFPLLLLALWHAAQGRPRWIMATAIIAAALLLSHPIGYPIFFFVGVWLLRLAWRHGWRVFSGPALGLGLGILLCAFSLLPALSELSATRAILTADQGYSYAENFLNLEQMLTFPRLPADPALLNPPVVRALPLLILLWASFRLIWRWRTLPPSRQKQVLDWVVLLLFSVWLITPLSRPVWDYVPLLPQILFPWRFLAMASLAAAMLLALALTADEQGGWRVTPLLILLSLGLLIQAIPWLYPPREPIPEAPTITDLAAFEAPPFFIGTTTLGEYLPRWVEELPDTTQLRQALITQADPDRLVPGPTFQVVSRTGSTMDATYNLRVTEPMTLTYQQFYFPGWQATLNEKPLTITPSAPHGLLEMRLPPGEHTLHLFFGPTSVRRWGLGLSLVAAALISLLPFIPGRYWAWLKPPSDEPFPLPTATPTRLYLPLAGLLLLTWGFFTTIETPLRRPTLLPDGVLGRPKITPLDFAGEVRLLSFEQSAEAIAAADPIELTLYWQALRPIGVTYDVGVHIVDANGVIWSQREAIRPYDWRFISGNDPWPLNGYRLDPFILSLLDGTPPGNYQFHVGLVRRDTQQTVAAYTIGAFTVDTPAQGDAPLEEGMIPAPIEATAAGLRLLGTRLDRREALPGDPLRLTLLWQVIDAAAVPTPGHITLEFISQSGQVIWQQTTPLTPTYPSHQWQTGDRLRTELLLRLPASLPPGEHTWQVRLSETPSFAVGPLRINTLERLWTPPSLVITTTGSLGDIATLLGANLTPQTLQPGLPLQVMLVWRNEAETTISYHVFLHLLGPDGTLITQADGEPANWTRPTTGWLPGEIVLDEHTLFIPNPLPPGEYTLAAGLYQPETGERLALADGGTMITVLTFLYAGK
ncbi:MAG: 6-pyruvoyl-tetrahydropterin synthase-related protein [Candidatus Promineifilaceae bacterium]